MAKKTLTQAIYSVDNIQNQPDQVKDQATALKLSFDQSAIDGRTYNNGVLLVELADESVGNSGSNTIGHNSTSVTADNVGDAIEENRQAISDIVLGQIPDNSLTNAKLAPDAKVGSLALLDTVNKTDVVSSINEVQAEVGTNFTNINIIRSSKLSTGTANAITIDTDGTFDLTKDRNILPFTPSLTNTGAMTVAADGQMVKAIKKFDVDTDGFIDVEEGDIKKNTPIQLTWSVSEDFFILAPKGGAVIKSIQRGTALFGNGVISLNVNISEVLESNSIILITVTSQSSQARENTANADFVDSDTIVFKRDTAAGFGTTTINWQVIEFVKLKSKQSGDVSVSTNPTNVAITSVNLEKAISFMTFKSPSTLEACDRAVLGQKLTASTNLEFSSIAASSGFDVKWVVVEAE